MLVDSHAHLDDPRLQADLPAVLDRARQAGLVAVITIGTGAPSADAAVALAQAHPGFIFAAAGVHPHEADRCDPTERAKIESLAASGRIVAIGEAGLDYHYNHSSHHGQQAVFDWQVSLAASTGLPLIIHCREAFDDCLAILRRHAAPALRGVAHCFSGNWQQARAFLDLGLHLSLAGPLTYPKSADLRDVAARARLDRILIETDCPYLAPQPVRGQRNEPALLTHTARALDALRPDAAEPASTRAAQNALRLFNIIPGQEHKPPV